MEYVANVEKEGENTLVEFPDCPGCQTFAGPTEDVEVQAQDALAGWLEAMLQEREIPPPPKYRGRKGRSMAISVPAQLAVKLDIRWHRDELGLSQAQLGKRLGMSQSAVAQLENPDSNPTIETLERVAHALGLRLAVDLRKAHRG